VFLTSVAKNRERRVRDFVIRKRRRSPHEPWMSAHAPSVRSPRASVPGALLSATLLTTFVGCGGDDGGEDANENGGTAGTAIAGGASESGAAGMLAGRGGSSSGATSSGGAGRGGSSSGSGGAGATAGKGGSGQGAAGSAGSSSAGEGSTDGSGGDDAVGGSAGKGGSPPSGGGNGGSPYEIECHGDTVDCGDPESLLCLGIRVGDEVFGYGCSNECETNADCSTEAAAGEATAACVDFVTTSYCLLVCQEGDSMKSCPGGMYCYNYPGSPIGYCLWE
jgi:hypothetical protein